MHFNYITGKMFKAFVLCFLSFLSIAAASGDPWFRDDYKFLADGSGWIKYHIIPAKWKDARLRCEMEGSILASPLGQQMTSEMAQLIKGKTDAIHTGIHATFSKGDYSSIEGVPLSDIPINWAPSEPNNADDNEDCLVLLNNGLVADANCNKVRPFICFKEYEDFSNSTSIQDCGTVDDAYKFSPVTGSCYKFHTNPNTWSRAYMTCEAEGGYLAIINSDQEARVLSRIFSNIPTSAITVIKNQVLAFIGFHDWGEHGSWRTIHGQTLDKAGYSKWGTLYGEPNNVSDASTNFQGEYCGSIYRNAELNDLWCDYVISFICEKDTSTTQENKLD